MTKQKAIRTFCLECAGKSKDVALCTDLGCGLWEFRLGFGLKSRGAKLMIERVMSNNPTDVAELAKYGLQPSDFLSPRPHAPRSKIARTEELGEK